MADRIGWLVEEDTDLEFKCATCERVVIVPPQEAVERFGTETPISAIRERGAKCRRCGSTDVRVGASLRSYYRRGGV